MSYTADNVGSSEAAMLAFDETFIDLDTVAAAVR
jgi:hypothetical protein